MPEESMSEVLKEEIERKGGIKAVAKRLGVTESAVYYWQSGKRKPSKELLKYLGLRRVMKLVRV